MFIPADTLLVVGYVAPGISGSIPSYFVKVKKLFSETWKLSARILIFLTASRGREYERTMVLIFRYELSLRKIASMMLASIGLELEKLYLVP